MRILLLFLFVVACTATTQFRPCTELCTIKDVYCSHWEDGSTVIPVCGDNATCNDICGQFDQQCLSNTQARACTYNDGYYGCPDTPITLEDAVMCDPQTQVVENIRPPLGYSECNSVDSYANMVAALLLDNPDPTDPRLRNYPANYCRENMNGLSVFCATNVYDDPFNVISLLTQPWLNASDFAPMSIWGLVKNCTTGVTPVLKNIECVQYTLYDYAFLNSDPNANYTWFPNVIYGAVATNPSVVRLQRFAMNETIDVLLSWESLIYLELDIDFAMDPIVYMGHLANFGLEYIELIGPTVFDVTNLFWAPMPNLYRFEISQVDWTNNSCPYFFYGNPCVDVRTIGWENVPLLFPGIGNIPYNAPNANGTRIGFNANVGLGGVLPVIFSRAYQCDFCYLMPNICGFNQFIATLCNVPLCDTCSAMSIEGVLYSDNYLFDPVLANNLIYDGWTSIQHSCGSNNDCTVTPHVQTALAILGQDWVGSYCSSYTHTGVNTIGCIEDTLVYLDATHGCTVGPSPIYSNVAGPLCNNNFAGTYSYDIVGINIRAANLSGVTPVAFSCLENFAVFEILGAGTTDYPIVASFVDALWGSSPNSIHLRHVSLGYSFNTFIGDLNSPRELVLEDVIDTGGISAGISDVSFVDSVRRSDCPSLTDITAFYGVIYNMESLHLVNISGNIGIATPFTTLTSTGMASLIIQNNDASLPTLASFDAFNWTVAFPALEELVLSGFIHPYSNVEVPAFLCGLDHCDLSGIAGLCNTTANCCGVNALCAPDPCISPANLAVAAQCDPFEQVLLGNAEYSQPYCDTASTRAAIAAMLVSGDPYANSSLLTSKNADYCHHSESNYIGITCVETDSSLSSEFPYFYMGPDLTGGWQGTDIFALSFTDVGTISPKPLLSNWSCLSALTALDFTDNTYAYPLHELPMSVVSEVLQLPNLQQLFISNYALNVSIASLVTTSRMSMFDSVVQLNADSFIHVDDLLTPTTHFFNLRVQSSPVTWKMHSAFNVSLPYLTTLQIFQYDSSDIPSLSTTDIASIQWSNLPAIFTGPAANPNIYLQFNIQTNLIGVMPAIFNTFGGLPNQCWFAAVGSDSTATTGICAFNSYISYLCNSVAVCNTCVGVAAEGRNVGNYLINPGIATSNYQVYDDNYALDNECNNATCHSDSPRILAAIDILGNDIVGDYCSTTSSPGSITIGCGKYLIEYFSDAAYCTHGSTYDPLIYTPLCILTYEGDAIIPPYEIIAIDILNPGDLSGLTHWNHFGCLQTLSHFAYIVPYDNSGYYAGPSFGFYYALQATQITELMLGGIYTQGISIPTIISTLSNLRVVSFVDVLDQPWNYEHSGNAPFYVNMYSFDACVYYQEFSYGCAAIPLTSTLNGNLNLVSLTIHRPIEGVTIDASLNDFSYALQILDIDSSTFQQTLPLFTTINWESVFPQLRNLVLTGFDHPYSNIPIPDFICRLSACDLSGVPGLCHTNGGSCCQINQCVVPTSCDPGYLFDGDSCTIPDHWNIVRMTTYTYPSFVDTQFVAQMPDFQSWDYACSNTNFNWLDLGGQNIISTLGDGRGSDSPYCTPSLILDNTMMPTAVYAQVAIFVSDPYCGMVPAIVVTIATDPTLCIYMNGAWVSYVNGTGVVFWTDSGCTVPVSTYMPYGSICNAASNQFGIGNQLGTFTPLSYGGFVELNLVPGHTTHDEIADVENLSNIYNDESYSNGIGAYCVRHNLDDIGDSPQCDQQSVNYQYALGSPIVPVYMASNTVSMSTILGDAFDVSSNNVNASYNICGFAPYKCISTDTANLQQYCFDQVVNLNVYSLDYTGAAQGSFNGPVQSNKCAVINSINGEVAFTDFLRDFNAAEFYFDTSTFIGDEASQVAAVCDVGPMYAVGFAFPYTAAHLPDCNPILFLDGISPMSVGTSGGGANTERLIISNQVSLNASLWAMASRIPTLRSITVAEATINAAIFDASFTDAAPVVQLILSNLELTNDAFAYSSTGLRQYPLRSNENNLNLFFINDTAFGNLQLNNVQFYNVKDQATSELVFLTEENCVLIAYANNRVSYNCKFDCDAAYNQISNQASLSTPYSCLSQLPDGTTSYGDALFSEQSLQCDLTLAMRRCASSPHYSYFQDQCANGYSDQTYSAMLIMADAPYNQGFYYNNGLGGLATVIPGFNYFVSATYCDYAPGITCNDPVAIGNFPCPFGIDCTQLAHNGSLNHAEIRAVHFWDKNMRHTPAFDFTCARHVEIAALFGDAEGLPGRSYSPAIWSILGAKQVILYQMYMSAGTGYNPSEFAGRATKLEIFKCNIAGDNGPPVIRQMLQANPQITYFHMAQTYYDRGDLMWPFNAPQALNFDVFVIDATTVPYGNKLDLHDYSVNLVNGQPATAMIVKNFHGMYRDDGNGIVYLHPSFCLNVTYCDFSQAGNAGGTGWYATQVPIANCCQLSTAHVYQYDGNGNPNPYYSYSPMTYSDCTGQPWCTTINFHPI